MEFTRANAPFAPLYYACDGGDDDAGDDDRDADDHDDGYELS